MDLELLEAQLEQLKASIKIRNLVHSREAERSNAQVATLEAKIAQAKAAQGE